MKKIKVAFFADILIEDYDGASRTMFQIIKRIPSEGFEFLFVCGVGPDKLFGFPCIQIPALTLPINTNYKIALPQLADARIKGKLLEFEPDIVHIATPSFLGQFALKYAQQYGLPVITIYHTHFISYVDYYLKHAPSLLVDFVKSKVILNQKSFYNQCNKIYIPSESIVDELIDIGIERTRIKIWKRGIDTKLFSPIKKNLGLIATLTGNNYPTILFASRLVWEKNLETLFRIYDCLQTKNLPHNFIIAGDGVARNFCENRMQKSIFIGKVDHAVLAELYASSDVFLFPSVSESYGNVVIEAMASGLPSVIADGGGSKDFIEQGINGFKCKPFNENDYVEKIEILLRNKDVWKQCSEEGLLYSQKFNWDELIRTYFTDVNSLARQTQFELKSLF